MEKGEAVYEFVDKFAYFACAGNIVLECYTMTDGEEAYKSELCKKVTLNVS